MSTFDKFKRGQSQLPAPGSGRAVASQANDAASRIIATARATAASSNAAEAVLNPKSARIAIALDATGSMGNLIQDAKANISEIVNRATSESGSRVDIQILVYRDYDVPQRLLEKSTLTNDPVSLAAWLSSVRADGGGANDGEAIEVALEAIYASEHFRAVILAGDEPSNSRAHLNSIGKHQKSTAHDWAKTFGQAKIPIHTFVVNNSPATIADFKAIAAISGGQSGRLDGSSAMIDMAVMAILATLKGAPAVRKYMANNQLSSNAESYGHLLISGPNGSR